MINNIKTNAPKGATHFNKYQILFPYEKHTKSKTYVWANKKWEKFNAPTCAEKIA